MKAVHQIIDYLNVHGLLTAEEIRRLRVGGFMPVNANQTEHEDVGPPTNETDDVDPTEVIERVKPRVGRSRGRKKPDASDSSTLLKKLGVLRDACRDRLEPLRQFGNAITPCQTWEDAAVAIRNAQPERLPPLLLSEIKRGAPTLPDLWSALGVDDYVRLLDNDGLPASTKSIFDAMLRSEETADMGVFGNLLSEPEVAAVFNLRRAQRKLHRGLGTALSSDPGLFSMVFRRDSARSAYWAFVVAYSARRGPPDEIVWPRGHERTPPQPPPGDDEWPALLARAMALDPTAVGPFLIARSQRWESFGSEMTDTIRLGFEAIGPRQETIIVDANLRSGSLSDLARRHGVTDADVRQALASFDSNLKAEIGRRPALTFLLFPDVTRNWPMFLADCLRLDPTSSLGSNFNTAIDLVCPKNWD